MSGLVSYGVASSDLPGGGRATMSTISFNPAVDVFVTDRWTLGLSATAARSESVASYTGAAAAPAGDQSGYFFAATPRVGRTFDLGDVTVWPKVALGYGVSRSEWDASSYRPAGRMLGRTVTGQLALDLVFPLSRHIFFDAGPSLGLRHTEADGDLALGDSDSVLLGMQAHLGVTLP